MYKDKTLDAKIIEASLDEFLEKGFRNASLRNIASRAGITTGALYTRYKNKDELFESLIKLDLAKIRPEIKHSNDLYMKAKETRNIDDFIYAIKQEEKLYLDLLFDNYLECCLIISKSEGSRLYATMAQALETKKQGTLEFFKEIQQRPFEIEIIPLLIDQNINFYRQILDNGYDKDKAQRLLTSLQIVIEACFKRIFQEII